MTGSRSAKGVPSRLLLGSDSSVDGVNAAPCKEATLSCKWTASHGGTTRSREKTLIV